MLICILRHGETDWNSLGKFQGREDIPLNQTGIEQAQDAAKYLAKYEWKVIITSPLSRAKITAEIISRETGNAEVLEESGFTERDYGKLSGTSSSERNKYFPDESIAGLESFEDLQNRIVNTLFRYIKTYDGNNIIIVSHGAAINSLLAYLSENKTRGIPVKNASITMLENAACGIKIVFQNMTAKELNI